MSSHNICLRGKVRNCQKSQRTTKPTIRLVRPANSYKPAHPRSLIRVFVVHMCLLQPPDYPKRDKRETLPCWIDHCENTPIQIY